MMHSRVPSEREAHLMALTACDRASAAAFLRASNDDVTRAFELFCASIHQKALPATTSGTNYFKHDKNEDEPISSSSSSSLLQRHLEQHQHNHQHNHQQNNQSSQQEEEEEEEERDQDATSIKSNSNNNNNNNRWVRDILAVTSSVVAVVTVPKDFLELAAIFACATIIKAAHSKDD